MIQPKTVFVLGAGASIDYGMPKTSDICHSVRALDLQGDRAAELFYVTNCGVQALAKFKRQFEASPYRSVDAFLEKRPDEPETQLVGKALIASAFMTRQIGHRPAEKNDWIRMVILKMLDGAPAWPQFQNNRVTFVTFNFDSVVEEVFTQSLPYSYPDVTTAAARTYITQRVLHVHGALPTLPGPESRGAHAAWLKEAISKISVIHEPGSEKNRVAARRAIHEADIVCFLGFGYHGENLKKLGFEPGSKPAPDAEIFLCGCGVTPTDRAEALNRIHTGKHSRQESAAWPVGHSVVKPSRTFGDVDHGAVKFLEEHHILRSQI
jgi:hypothetical protein